MRLVQLTHESQGRRVAIVEEPSLILLSAPGSIHELAQQAIANSRPIRETAESLRSSESIAYDAVYNADRSAVDSAQQSPWRLLPAFDHPSDPMHCLVTGTGLTHKASAENREKMHAAQAAGETNDSMRMYLLGVEGGKPPAGQIGAQPEWFYKGTGLVLRGHGQTLARPAYADDGGEEAEVAAVYIIDESGAPRRIGFATANEFSDHVMEKKNYLYLAHSKLRQCSLGPELCLDETFQEIKGAVQLIRRDEVVWSHDVHTGEAHMAHGLANLEHHHFKYAEHRVPGQAHVHFLGAAALSFGANISLEDGDVMEIAWEGMGRPLRNPLEIAKQPDAIVAVKSLAG